MTILLLYLPVPHQYYKRLFAKYRDVDAVYLLGSDVLTLLPYLAKNVPALDPYESCAAVNAMGWCKIPVEVVDVAGLEVLSCGSHDVIMPDEDISRAVAAKWFDSTSRTITYYHGFLRWDKSAAKQLQDVVPGCVVSQAEFDRQIMQRLEQDRHQSLDFWRQVAGAIVKDGQVLCTAHNEHVPHPQNPLFFGDPRSSFSRGVSIELSTAFHCEQAMISQCAKVGESTAGASLYVTTFPCPWCAKAVARSGISVVYFKSGYSVLDAQSVLQAANVQLVQVVE